MLPHRTASSRRANKGFVRVNPKLEKQLGAYAAAVGATAVAALAVAPLASAEIIYTPVNVALGSYQLDLNNDGTPDFTLFRCHCGGSHTSWLLLGLDVPGNAVRPGRNTEIGAGPLPVGALVGNKQSFITQTFYYGVWMADAFFYGTISDQGGPWINATNKYLGLKFLIDGQVHFGWARLTVGSWKLGEATATLTGYAYETIPGRLIHAGQQKEADAEEESSDIDPTPESTLGVLALGADGLKGSPK